MVKISSAGLRAPAPYEGLDLNHCKNPTCRSFGVPESAFRTKRPPGATPQPGDYSLASSGKGKPVLKCALCNETFPMRSNRAVYEELSRITAYLIPDEDTACVNVDCILFDVPVDLAGDLYCRFGSTAAGTPRYRCGACMKTFSGRSRSTIRQRMPHKNRDVFSMLINKAPIRRMGEMTGLSPQTLYDKVDFIYRQCLAFCGERERPLLNGRIVLPKLYLSTDRQTVAVNWSNRKDRRNITLQSIATADLKSGYVFGMDLNFDPSLNLDEVEAMVHVNGDQLLAQPYRRYARLWLRSDYEAAVAEALTRKNAKKALKATGKDALQDEIRANYADAEIRDDVEEVSIPDGDQLPPTSGVEVRDQYTVYAHFLMLERLIGYARKLRFYMDQDSGFRAAFMSAFHQQIKARRADGWYVKVLKESTVDQKTKAVANTQKRMAAFRAKNPDVKEHEIHVQMTLEEMARMATIGKWNDRWLVHPVPTKAEPDKRLCWLTNIGLEIAEGETVMDAQRHAARLFLKGSLHAVDRFFMLTRRRLSLAERPYGTASNDRRMWYGYAAYRPENLAKALTILKVAYNYHLADQDGRTPAMKLGLAMAPIPLEDILYFTPQ